jgi:IclR family transcriptional regulator, pca regulon regulatory protein
VTQKRIPRVKSSPGRNPTLPKPAKQPWDGDAISGEASLKYEDDREFVQSLARGLAVLMTFSDKRRDLSIAQISHRTGIPRAAVRRSLRTLAYLDYVGTESANRFRLRPRVLAFADAYLSATPIAVIAQPALDHLSETVNESCSLGVLDGDEMVYLARSSTSRILSPTLNVGRRLPAYCTSIGRVLLANLGQSPRLKYLSRIKLHPFTDRTISSVAELGQILRSVQRAGYAICDQQMTPGIRTIAVPVRDRAGSVVAGINILTQTESVAIRSMPTRFLTPLQDAALRLGEMLPK